MSFSGFGITLYQAKGESGDCALTTEIEIKDNKKMAKAILIRKILFFMHYR
jgi:hypothetical protein